MQIERRGFRREAQSFYILHQVSLVRRATRPGLADVNLRREEELAEAAVEERNTGLERYVSFKSIFLSRCCRRTPKTRMLRTMVVFSGEVASL